MKHTMIRCGLLIAIASSLPITIQAEDQNESMSATAETIYREMHIVVYDEFSAEAFAKKYGTSATSILVSILESNAELRVKAKVCFYLGKIGDVRGVQPVIDFLEQPFANGLSADDFAYYRLAALGLGYFGTEQALTYLEQRFSAEYWESRRKKEDVTRPGYSLEDSIRGLRKDALHAISRGGNTEAKETLIRLKASEAEYPVEKIDTALRENEMRMTGLHLQERELQNPTTPILVTP